MSNIKLKKIVKSKKRVGRGPGSGRGKTSGRGMNGQRSRAGADTKHFEGGQTPLKLGLPKRKGFKKQRKVSLSVNSRTLNRIYKSADEISVENLCESLKISKQKAKLIKYVKIFGVEKINSTFKSPERFVLSRKPKVILEKNGKVTRDN